MTTTLGFVCKYLLYLQHSSETYCAGCPNNFPLSHCLPTTQDIFRFCLKSSDIIDEIGIALMKDEIFLGWITRSDHDILYTRLEEGEVIYGAFAHIESFEWGKGGGRCYRGTTTIL